jgi:hypothetical protein
MSKKIVVAEIKDGQSAGPEEGLASLAGGWEGSEDLVEHTLREFRARQKIDAGIQAADEGRVIPHEDVKKRFLPQ